MIFDIITQFLVAFHPPITIATRKKTSKNIDNVLVSETIALTLYFTHSRYFETYYWLQRFNILDFPHNVFISKYNYWQFLYLKFP